MAMAIAMTATSSSGSSTGGGGGGGGAGGGGGVPAWWETIAKARSAIQSLSTILGPLEALEAVQESERPAKALLESHDVAASISARVDDAASGSASDALCQWLYDTFQAGDPDLQLVVLRYVPQVAGLYLSRVVSQGGRAEPLAGFEAVLLALYTSEVKARGGRPLSVHVADLGQASLYHQPLNASPEASLRPIVGQLCAPLEPHAALKSTKRAAVVGVALDLFYRKIALMPPAAKAEFCHFVQGWAGQNCSCVHKLDRPSDVARPVENRFEDEIVESPNGNIGRLSNDLAKFGIEDGSSGSANGGGNKSLIHLASSSSSSDSWNSSSALAVVAIGESRAKGARIPLPWELVQPILRILGHCLLAPLILQEVRDAASVATRMLFARVSHDLVPEAILATRSLVKLDVAARQANAIGRSAVAGPVAITATSSIKTTKKPEVLLVSK